MNVGNFFYDLCSYIDGLAPQEFGTRNGKIYVVQAEFQADAVMAHRLVNKISDIALCADSDLAAMAGPDCISIKEINYNNKQISSVELFCF